MEYTEFELDNGLRVVHNYDPFSAMAVVNVLYDTGARDENPELTGMAHLFEHLMFGGSVNVPSFDSVLELAGGTNNASTGNDFTNFYDQLPAQNIETAFYLESDRMLGLAFSDKALEVQRQVVVEEFKQVCLNRPYGCLMHHLRPMLYDQHPYRWPVIGKETGHIEKVTQDDVRHWFYSHYAPNNAILSVCGNVTADRVRELAEKWFGPIPRRDVEKRHLADDPWPTAITRKTVEENVPQTVVTVAYRMDPYGTKGYVAADAITDILSAGKSSRFNQRLVLGCDLFTGADASITGSEHSGMVIMQGYLAKDDDETIAEAERMLIEQAQQLAEEGNISEYELERTKNRFESTFTLDNVNLIMRAYNLATATYHREDVNDNLRRYRALTIDDIASTARHLFVDHAPAVLVHKPAR